MMADQMVAYSAVQTDDLMAAPTADQMAASSAVSAVMRVALVNFRRSKLLSSAINQEF